MSLCWQTYKVYSPQGIERGIRVIMGGFAGQAAYNHYGNVHPTASRAIRAIGRNVSITFSQSESMNVNPNPVELLVQMIPEGDVAGLAQPIIEKPILPITDGELVQQSNEERESENGALPSQGGEFISLSIIPKDALNIYVQVHPIYSRNITRLG